MAIIIIELYRIYCYYFNQEYHFNNIENAIIIIASFVGVSYLYKFLKIIQEISLIKFIIAISLFTIVKTAVIDDLFINLIDIIKLKGLM